MLNWFITIWIFQIIELNEFELGPFTVFVPLDQAFEALIERFGGKNKAADEFEKNPEVLEAVTHISCLLFHPI